MPVVPTGTITTPVLGAWRRLSLISSDGSLIGIESKQLFGRLEELGIPTHQHPLARTLLSWQHARIPPDVAFALWLIRERQESSGCIFRLTDSSVCEGGPAIRYIQLATAVGETQETDPALKQTVSWLLDQQLSDGSIPDLAVLERGEVGSTARALRALSGLNEPSLDKPIRRMQGYLERTAVEQTVGVAWPNKEGDPYAVIGSTSLAILALLKSGYKSTLVPDALQFLLSAQSKLGGWPPIVGYKDSVHNTFNALRAIRAGQEAGLVDEDLTPVITLATKWFLRLLKQHPPHATVDIAFALRLANVLDLLDHKVSERLALDLSKRRRKTLSATADLYADTEIMALALLECSQRLDESPAGYNRWSWRLTLPSLPPPFLLRQAHFYEALYATFRGRWWLRIVDLIARISLVEGIAGLLLGIIASLGIVDDRLTSILILGHPGARTIASVALLALLIILWIGVRIAAYPTAQGLPWTSTVALVAALAITWIVEGSRPIPLLAAIIGLYWLIIDVVSFTADRSGLLERLLPRD